MRNKWGILLAEVEIDRNAPPPTNQLALNLEQSREIGSKSWPYVSAYFIEVRCAFRNSF